MERRGSIVDAPGKPLADARRKPLADARRKPIAYSGNILAIRTAERSTAPPAGHRPACTYDPKSALRPGLEVCIASRVGKDAHSLADSLANSLANGLEGRFRTCERLKVSRSTRSNFRCW